MCSSDLGRLSGLCQPDYVLDIPGGHGKVPLSAPYASVCEAADTLRPTRYTITDYCGGAHDYVDQLSGKTSAASENL